jgi:hypothetical protein
LIALKYSPFLVISSLLASAKASSMVLEEPNIAGSELVRRDALSVTELAGHKLSLSRYFPTIAKMRRLAGSGVNSQNLIVLEGEAVLRGLKRCFELLDSNTQ